MKIVMMMNLKKMKNNKNVEIMKNIKLALVFIFLFSLEGFSQQVMQRTIVEKGISLGSVLAIVTSWERNKSVLWALIHGLFSWVYVVYYVITRE